MQLEKLKVTTSGTDDLGEARPLIVLDNDLPIPPKFEVAHEIVKRCNAYPDLELEVARLRAALSMTREGVDSDEAMRIQNCQPQ